jgi:beta-keto acid cleavage enzyme
VRSCIILAAQADGCVRVLLEITEDLPPDEAVAAARLLVAALGPDSDGIPVLLHGEGTSAWPVFKMAVRRGLQARIGLEDALVLPGGSPTRGNADLVTAARALIAGSG